MTKRLATMCLVSMFLIGLASSSIRAQDALFTRPTLKGISALGVIVEDLPPDTARILGLSTDAIQTDVELKLRLAGMRVVTPEEGHKLPGQPAFYVRVTLTDDGRAASIEIQLLQNVLLVRNSYLAPGVATWEYTTVRSNPTAERIRNGIKDQVDTFLNAWLSVNPKK